MSKLSPQTRALFDAARDSDEPTDEDAARVRSKLLLRVGAGVVAGAAGSAVAGSTAAAAAKPLAALGFKLVLALVVAGGAAGVVYSMSPSEQVMAPASSGATTPVLHASREASRVAATAEETAEESSAPVAAVDTEAPTATATDGGARKDNARTPATPAAAAPRDDISGETALLDEAQAALRQGRADAALRTLDEHAQRYGDGVLREERLGARILALCRLGRVEEARAEAARFLRQAPRSPVAARVRGSCAAP